jgi:hypothetical protein
VLTGRAIDRWGHTPPTRNRTVASSDQAAGPTGGFPAASALDGPCRSQSDAWVGCIAWSTTERSSAVRMSRVNLVAPAGPEGLDDPSCVVAAPVEAAVHRRLDPPVGGLEHRGHG